MEPVSTQKDRRNFLRGIGAALLYAPAIVRASSLMPISTLLIKDVTTIIVEKVPIQYTIKAVFRLAEELGPEEIQLFLQTSKGYKLIK
jgi:hypothetical protein